MGETARERDYRHRQEREQGQQPPEGGGLEKKVGTLTVQALRAQVRTAAASAATREMRSQLAKRLRRLGVPVVEDELPLDLDALAELESEADQAERQQ